MQSIRILTRVSGQVCIHVSCKASFWTDDSALVVDSFLISIVPSYYCSHLTLTVEVFTTHCERTHLSGTKRMQ